MPCLPSLELRCALLTHALHKHTSPVRCAIAVVCSPYNGRRMHESASGSPGMHTCSKRMPPCTLEGAAQPTVHDVQRQQN